MMSSPATSSPIVADVAATAKSSGLAMTPGSAAGNGASPIFFSPSPSSSTMALSDTAGSLRKVADGSRTLSPSLSPHLKLSQQDLSKMYAEQQSRTGQVDLEQKSVGVVDELSLCGVGLILSRHIRHDEGGEDDEQLVVAALPDGESAALDGFIRVGDIVTSIAGMPTKGLGDDLLRALVLGCEGTDVSFSFERLGEEGGVYSLRLRRKRSRTMSPAWHDDATLREGGDATFREGGDATLHEDGDATLREDGDDRVAAEGSIDAAPRYVPSVQDSPGQGMDAVTSATVEGRGEGDGEGDGGSGGSSREASTISNIEPTNDPPVVCRERSGGSNIPSGSDAGRRRETGSGEGGVTGTVDQGRERVVEGLQHELISARENLEEMTSERDALRRTLEGAAIALKEASRQEVEEIINAKRSLETERDAAVVERDALLLERDAAVARAKGAEGMLAAWGRAGGGRDEVERVREEESRRALELVARLEDENEELKIQEEKGGRDRRKAAALMQEMEEKIRELTKRLKRADARGDELWKEVQELLRKETDWNSSIESSLGRAELAEEALAKGRKEAEEALAKGRKEAEEALARGRKEAKEKGRKEAEEALARGRKEAEETLVRVVSASKELGERLERAEDETKKAEHRTQCETEKLHIAQSELREAEKKAAEAQDLNQRLEGMLSDARTELSDAQSQAAEANHRYLSEVDAHKATRLELEREKWKSSESERRSAEAIGRMGDALSLMDEAVSRASMLEVKLEDATARATEAEVRASKLEARVGDAKSPAKSPRRGGEAEEGGRAERRAWHDARLKALDAEETAEAHRKRAEEAEAGLKALTGEISRMNLTIAEQQHALKVSQSECLELRLLREAMTIRDAEIARARVKEDEFRKRELEHNDEVERARGEGFAAAQSGFNRMQGEVDRLLLELAEERARVQQVVDERDRLVREQERMNREKQRRDAAADDNAAAAAVVSRRMMAATAENEALSRSVSVLTAEKQLLESRLDGMANMLKANEDCEMDTSTRGRLEAQNRMTQGGRLSSSGNQAGGGARLSGEYSGETNDSVVAHVHTPVRSEDGRDVAPHHGREGFEALEGGIDPSRGSRRGSGYKVQANADRGSSRGAVPGGSASDMDAWGSVHKGLEQWRDGGDGRVGVGGGGGGGGGGEWRREGASPHGSVNGHSDRHRAASPTPSASHIAGDASSSHPRSGSFAIPSKAQIFVPFHSNFDAVDDRDQGDDCRRSESPRPPPRRSTASPRIVAVKVKSKSPRMEGKASPGSFSFHAGGGDGDSRAGIQTDGIYSNYLSPPHPISTLHPREQQQQQQQHDQQQEEEQQIPRQLFTASPNRPPFPQSPRRSGQETAEAGSRGEGVAFPPSCEILSQELPGGSTALTSASDFILVTASGARFSMRRTPFCNPIPVHGKVVPCEMHRTVTGGWLFMDHAADVAGQIAMILPSPDGSQSHSLCKCVAVSQQGALAVILVASARDQAAGHDLLEGDDATLPRKITPRLFPCGVVSERDAFLISGQTVRMIFCEDA